MFSKEQAINILISLNKDLVVYIFSLYIKGMRSFYDMNQAGIYFRSILRIEEGGKNSIWREILREMRNAILTGGAPDIYYGGLETSIFYPYDELFKIRTYDFNIFPIIGSWNKYRFYFDKNMELIILDNDSIRHKIQFMTQLATTKLYCTVRTNEIISIYTDEPWNDKYLIFREKIKYENDTEFGGFKLVETIYGLVLVKIFKLSHNSFIYKHYLFDPNLKKAKSLNLEITSRESISGGHIVNENIYYGSTFILKTTTTFGTVTESLLIRYNGEIINADPQIKNCDYLSITGMVGYDMLCNWYGGFQSLLINEDGWVIGDIKKNMNYQIDPFSNGFFDFFYICEKKINENENLINVIDTISGEPITGVKIKNENISIRSHNSFITRRNNEIGYYIWIGD